MGLPPSWNDDFHRLGERTALTCRRKQKKVERPCCVAEDSKTHLLLRYPEGRLGPLTSFAINGSRSLIIAVVPEHHLTRFSPSFRRGAPSAFGSGHALD